MNNYEKICPKCAMNWSDCPCRFEEQIYEDDWKEERLREMSDGVTQW